MQRWNQIRLRRHLLLDEFHPSRHRIELVPNWIRGEIRREEISTFSKKSDTSYNGIGSYKTITDRSFHLKRMLLNSQTRELERQLDHRMAIETWLVHYPPLFSNKHWSDWVCSKRIFEIDQTLPISIASLHQELSPKSTPPKGLPRHTRSPLSSLVTHSFVPTTNHSSHTQTHTFITINQIAQIFTCSSHRDSLLVSQFM